MIPVTDSDLIAAIAAQPQDDQAREDAIASLKRELANAAAGDVAQGAIQAVVDDYAFAVGLAGDLGGAEPI